MLQNSASNKVKPKERALRCESNVMCNYNMTRHAGPQEDKDLAGTNRRASMKVAAAYVCKHSGPPSLCVDPDKKKVDTVHTEPPSCHGGSCHTRHQSRRQLLQNEQHRNDTILSGRGSYILGVT